MTDDPSTDIIEPTVITYQAVADEYADRHADRSQVDHLVEDFLERVDGGQVLDVGCGPGWESETFAEAGYDVVALDITPPFCRATRERVPTAAVCRGDMRALPVASATVDGLWACASFLHVPRAEADATLAEVERVCAPGGICGCSVKAGDGTARRDVYDGDDRRFTLYTAAELRERLARAGFSVDDIAVEDGWVQGFASVPER